MVPVLRPTWRNSMGWMAPHIQGCRVEGLQCDLGHLLMVGLGIQGDSVGSTGCSSGATRSSLWKVWCQMFSVQFPLVTMPHLMEVLWGQDPPLILHLMPTITPWCHWCPSSEGENTARGEIDEWKLAPAGVVVTHGELCGGRGPVRCCDLRLDKVLADSTCFS